MTDKQKLRLKQVRAIVAKARSTKFEGERRVFLEGAEKLIAKYGLDRKATGIDGGPIQTRPGPQRENLFSQFMRERMSEHERDLSRNPGGHYSYHQLKRAAEMRREGRTWKEIGRILGIKATGHLSKTLRNEWSHLLRDD